LTARSRFEAGARFGTFLCASGVAVVTLAIIVVLTTQGMPFFSGVSLREFLTGTEWRPTSFPARFGVLPLFAGTMLVTVGSALIAVPLGVLSAIYLNEFASHRVRTALRPALDLLAGIPTVVYGYLGLFLVTPILRQMSDRFQASNAASAAIVVGIMILPMVSSLVEDAMHAVPVSLREGGYALGLTKAEVTLKLVVPAAGSGIAAAFILALSRAIGETMAVTLAAGSTPQLTLDPTQSVATITSYTITTAQGDAAAGSVRYTSMFVLGLLLFATTFVFNALGQRLISSVRRRFAT
jgi:phosphate transport system permease protein